MEDPKIDPAQQAQNEPVAEDSNVATPPVAEETTSEQPVTDSGKEETQKDETAAEETKAEPEAKPTRRERRLQALLEENKQLKQQPTQSPAQPQLNEDGEITLESLAQTIDTAADLRARQESQRLRAELSLENDVANLPKEYPELDESSDDHNPVAIEEIDKEFRRQAFPVLGVDAQGNEIRGFNPNVRLKDIAASYMRVAKSIATKTSAGVATAEANAEDTSAVAPSTGAPAKEIPFSELSKEEMEKKLGIFER